MFRPWITTLGIASLSAVLACGYSEEEWQAQLGKYNQVIAQNKAQHAQIEKMNAELGTAKQKNDALEKQLLDMGIAVETKGQEIATLSSDMTKMRQALAEYQERAKVLERIRARMIALRSKLDSLTKLGLDVSIRKNRMVISLPGDILFESGRTDLKDDGKNILRSVATVINQDPTLLRRDFQVAGHTDNKAFQGGPYVDNWGLSLMRARKVLVFLVTPPNAKVQGVGDARLEPGGGLPPERWSASGFGSTDPVVENSSPDNMQKNRRVELVVVPSMEEMLDLRSLATVP